MAIQPAQYIVGSSQWLLTGLSAEVAWRLPSFYPHRFCGIRDGQLSIPSPSNLRSFFFLGKYFLRKSCLAFSIV
jgi:hypothetical protein|uniref:Uncharacterized protein n=1 Tax=Zea mays TaxID=4577 RepID=B4FXD4_MAIZE|nr:unknown [Zea mays]